MRAWQARPPRKAQRQDQRGELLHQVVDPIQHLTRREGDADTTALSARAAAKVVNARLSPASA